MMNRIFQTLQLSFCDVQAAYNSVPHNNHCGSSENEEGVCPEKGMKEEMSTNVTNVIFYSCAGDGPQDLTHTGHR